MSLRKNAYFRSGITKMKFWPVGPNGSIMIPFKGKTEVAIFGGAGPFDMSLLTGKKGTLTIKIGAVEQSQEITIPAGHTIGAVTVDQMVTLIQGASFTDVTATNEDGYLKLLSSGAGVKPEEDYIQAYGQIALLSKFGNGYGARPFTIDTQKSFSMAAESKDDTTIETEDANTLVTSIVIPGSRTGAKGSVEDTADDSELKAMVTGGTLFTDGTYYAPLSDSVKSLFSVEAIAKLYRADKNQKDGYIAVKKMTNPLVSATESGAGDGGSGFQNTTFALTATPYNDIKTGVKLPDTMEVKQTRGAFDSSKWDDL